MKVLLFGTGNFYDMYKECFRNVEIIGLLDNDPLKQGQELDNVTIYSPAQGVRMEYVQIWLLSFHARDMREQLRKLGVAEEKIYDVHDLYRGLGDFLSAPAGELCLPDGCRRIAEQGEARGKVVLLTPNLYLNGAEIALVQLVSTLKEIGYDILVCTLYDGPLRNDVSALGVPVIIMGQVAHDIPLTSFDYLDGAVVYILNTIEMYMLLQKRDMSVPVLWWLHDSEMVYQETGITDAYLRNLDLSGLGIYYVSELAAKAFCNHYGRVLPMKEMPFGLQDWCKHVPGRLMHVHPLTFAVIGFLSERKGQSVLLQAVQLLPDDMRQACRFYVIGKGCDTELVQMLQSQAASLPEIEFLGELGREALLRFYAEELDVLVCPSRSDTLPIVTVEAMMFSRPVIASTGVGTAKMLAARGGGLVVPVDDAEALAKAMQWIFEHPGERISMGEQARKIYEREFTTEDFRERVKEAMLGILRDRASNG